jgi:hypothetical protein
MRFALLAVVSLLVARAALAQVPAAPPANAPRELPPELLQYLAPRSPGSAQNVVVPMPFSAPSSIPNPQPISLPQPIQPGQSGLRTTPVPGATLPMSPIPTAGPTDPELKENLTSFDSFQTNVLWQDGRWQVVAGTTVVKDFGNREREARQALRLIREMHLSEHGTIGSPQPVMEYWLRAGQAPEGLGTDLRLVPIDQTSLRVEQEQGQWCLRDNFRVLFNFALRQDEAQQALGVLRKYGFTRVGALGQGAPLMLVFMNPPTDPHSAAAAMARLARPAAPPGTSPTPPPPNSPAADLLAKYPGAAMNHVVMPAVPLMKQPTPQGTRTTFGGGTIQEITPVHHVAPVTGSVPRLTDVAERVPLDWRQVRLQQEGANWKLVAGSYTVGNFGKNERDARTALAAIQFYQLTEHCMVGAPKPTFSYFLSHGQPPRGLMMGLFGQSFRPEALEVQQVGDRWAICSSGQPLVRLGDKPEEARQMLEVIQRHKFDTLCHLGGGEEEGMNLLLRSR